MEDFRSDFRNRPLGRLEQFDARSRQYAATVGIEEKPFRSYTWSCDAYYDQGSEGACVGFAWTHELEARPKVVRRDTNFALQIYRRAQQIDPWPGEDYSGTSVLAGVKAVQELVNTRGRSFIPEYRWAFGIQDALRVIGYKGPLVLGIKWYTSMYEPDAKNFVHVGGEVAGGHAILANGVKIVKKDPTIDYPPQWEDIDIDKSYVRLHNSWGTDYGDGGDAFITVRDLDKLLQDGGEACIPSKRSFDR